MLTHEQRRYIKNLDEQISLINKEKEKINPFINLKQMNNKVFGEVFSEGYILEHCSNFTRADSKGWDLSSVGLGRVEVKSSRLPCKQITFNQCHPEDCDYFLFVEYDTEDAEVYKFLVPSKDFYNFSYTVQHERTDKNDASCFSMSGSSAHNRALLEKYKILEWQDLNNLAGGCNG